MDRKRDILQVKVTLTRVKPSVWRRIEVPASYTFWELHVAIQDAMGWTDSHLHAFRVHDGHGQKVAIGIPDEDGFEGDEVYLPGWKQRVSDDLNVAGARAKYDYDFGDDWVHDVRVEAVEPRAKGVRYPRCTAGARRCPPEDCGGPQGYAELLATIADPGHEEHESTLTWLGGSFDPSEFDPAAVQFDDPAERWRIAFG